jgi:hypothetical protein
MNGETPAELEAADVADRIATLAAVIALEVHATGTVELGLICELAGELPLLAVAVADD